MDADNDNNSSQSHSQQLEGQDRLSRQTDDNHPLPPERFEGNNDSSSSQSQQLEDEDRLSTLTDDILLSILGKVSLHMAVRTAVLSTRWMHLPWLLPELSIDVKDFLSVPCPDPIQANDMEKAMVCLTNATRSFLADRQKESTISSLNLKLYLINTSLCEVGALVGDAIDSGLLKDFDLAVLDVTEPQNCGAKDMLQRAKEIDGFFSAYPSMLHCLTRLSLHNLGFDKLDMHHVLFDCCKQVTHLSLSHCDTGVCSLFKIDAPNSKLRVLELVKCRFQRLEVVCLPKLEKFRWSTWISRCVPLNFGFVPSLGELELSCCAMTCQPAFKLSEILYGMTCIHTLTLDFQGENLWMQPEMKQLCTYLNKLRKLCVRGIFVEFDLLWTAAFLAAAPSVEMLHIEVWDHPCDGDDESREQGSFSKRRAPRWEMDFNDSKNLLLKELEFVGFRSLEQQFTFIRYLLERSPNLQKITLKGDEECEMCKALDVPSKFPKKDDQEMIVSRIRDGTFLPEVIFDE
ncbi:hypothetical protein QYE76_060269 [Lolium multiflorum]|uniref:At1g61320/AtMIF1 LRR domain-containing protein n=1 Tax=Lolium multiflorum TaxID=4521 RepID=A0AAD8RYQ4_LOLMU|nr:hypothetical protein QYE76_060269 [Lolium multiflorum]